MNTNQNQQLLRNEASITTAVQGLRNQILDGEVDALQAFVTLGKIEKVVSEVKKDATVLDYALGAYDKYNAKDVTLGDCKVSAVEAGVKYYFSECGDAVLEELYKEEAGVKAKIKDRETFLKSVKKKTLIADPETGEIYSICPPAKSSKTTLKLTFKKS